MVHRINKSNKQSIKKNLKSDKQITQVPIKRTKALVLFSGGLDSRVVVKLLQEQKIETELLYFSLPFGCGCCNNLECNFNFSQTNNARIHILDCTKGKLFYDYLKIIKNPKYGYGRGLNPCIHCRIFMLKEAKTLMKKFNCDFIATGEVLGQRPMSQYKQAILNIEKEAKLKGKILRPLSAKLLPETIAEKKGLVDRTKLLDINGRKRTKQIELATKYKIKFPNPAGGCLLCDRNYTKKLQDLFNKNSLISPPQIAILRIGRHFRAKGKIVLGRNEKENNLLGSLNNALKWHTIVPPALKASPTVIFEHEQDKVLVKALVQAYSSKDLSLREKFNSLKLG